MPDGGRTVINSSVVGLTSDAGISAYATAKHALVGLMRTLAKEWSLIWERSQRQMSIPSLTG
ncbi:SDR family NAD(P)-dependent oxidoreductase [Actinoplanes sp. NPDC051513]|uniref:SDR family NAD(P)-dependent oxidoreductase n=1 Tax=Actinoplanes sp. NPDC051513 TaxID=3363908 RepID=UPI0037AEDB9D